MLMPTLRPDLIGAHSALGIALQYKGDLEGAIKEYREALRLNSDSPVVRKNLGFALWAKGDFEGAASHLREVVRAKPDYPLAHYNLGVALQAKGDGDDSLSEYRDAVRLRPDFPEAHTNLGSALQSKGELNQAILEYRQAVHLKPDLPVAHNDLVRLKPDYSSAIENLGSVLQSQGDIDGAIAEFREWTRLDPENWLALNNLGIALATLFGLALLERGSWYGAIRNSLRLPPLTPKKRVKRDRNLISSWACWRRGAATSGGQPSFSCRRSHWIPLIPWHFRSSGGYTFSEITPEPLTSTWRGRLRAVLRKSHITCALAP